MREMRPSSSRMVEDCSAKEGPIWERRVFGDTRRWKSGWRVATETTRSRGSAKGVPVERVKICSDPYRPLTTIFTARQRHYTDCTIVRLENEERGGRHMMADQKCRTCGGPNETMEHIMTTCVQTKGPGGGTERNWAGERDEGDTGKTENIFIN